MQQDHVLASVDYKVYLNHRLDNDHKGRGARSSLARAIGCQSAYLSSVLRGAGHLTPEQGEAINQYFSHSDDESEYFLLLLQWQRSGTELLKKRLMRRMIEIKQRRFNLKNRLNAKNVLDSEKQSIYFSEWYYAAVHALLTIPKYRTRSAVAQYLKLEPALVNRAIGFLIECGLVLEKWGVLEIGSARMHLGSESPMITKHHLNWRLQAMQSLSTRSEDDVHYSSVVTFSAKDADRIKEGIVQIIKDTKSIVRDSKEEMLGCFAIDFFKL